MNLDGSYGSQLAAIHYLAKRKGWKLINKNEGNSTLFHWGWNYAGYGDMYKDWADVISIDQIKQKIKIGFHFP